MSPLRPTPQPHPPSYRPSATHLPHKYASPLSSPASSFVRTRRHSTSSPPPSPSPSPSVVPSIYPTPTALPSGTLLASSSAMPPRAPSPRAPTNQHRNDKRNNNTNNSHSNIPKSITSTDINISLTGDEGLSLSSVINPLTTPGVSANSVRVLGKRLGKGSYGSVWLGTYSGSLVAVKLCPLSRDGVRSAAYQHFRRETFRYQQLRHPCIVQFFCVVHDTAGEQLQLVTELMKGGSLYDGIRQLKRAGAKSLPLLNLLNTATQIANGLKFLHASGFSFGDLKTMNVLMSEPPDVRRKQYTPTTQAKLCDFGLSQNLTRLNSSSSSSHGIRHDGSGKGKKNGKGGGTPAGTYAYMAPECFSARGGNLSNPADAKAADVYALGVVLWELITLQVPWQQCGHMMQVMRNVTSGKRPEWPKDVKVSTALRHVVEMCWAQNAPERPTAHGAAELLMDILQDAYDACSASELLVEDEAQNVGSTSSTDTSTGRSGSDSVSSSLSFGRFARRRSKTLPAKTADENEDEVEVVSSLSLASSSIPMPLSSSSTADIKSNRSKQFEGLRERNDAIEKLGSGEWTAAGSVNVVQNETKREQQEHDEWGLITIEEESGADAVSKDGTKDDDGVIVDIGESIVLPSINNLAGAWVRRPSQRNNPAKRPVSDPSRQSTPMVHLPPAPPLAELEYDPMHLPPAPPLAQLQCDPEEDLGLEDDGKVATPTCNNSSVSHGSSINKFEVPNESRDGCETSDLNAIERIGNMSSDSIVDVNVDDGQELQQHTFEVMVLDGDNTSDKNNKQMVIHPDVQQAGYNEDENNINKYTMPSFTEMAESELNSTGATFSAPICKRIMTPPPAPVSNLRRHASNNIFDGDTDESGSAVFQFKVMKKLSVVDNSYVSDMSVTPSTGDDDAKVGIYRQGQGNGKRQGGNAGVTEYENDYRVSSEFIYDDEVRESLAMLDANMDSVDAFGVSMSTRPHFR